jgi:hypothetical protein
MKEEEIRRWRKLHDEKIHTFSFSPDIVRVVQSRRTSRVYTSYIPGGGGEARNVYKILVGRSQEENIVLGRRLCGWNNITSSLRERRCKDMDGIRLTYGGIQMANNLRVP